MPSVDRVWLPALLRLPFVVSLILQAYYNFACRSLNGFTSRCPDRRPWIWESGSVKTTIELPDALFRVIANLQRIGW
jgi:hypothetical protein